MRQETSVPGNPEPGPDNFDFEAWLDGESTFPEFDHTVYVDQKAGVELARVDDDLEEMVAEQAALDKQIEARTQQSSNSFVDATLDRMLGEREELDAYMKNLVAKRDELREQIKKSAITLYFQVKTPEELGNVTREATRQFHKENRQFEKSSEDDLDYITARSRYLLTAQIAHFCTGMKLHKNNRDVPAPTRQGADKLLSKLISSEMMRLMEAMGTGLSASQDWANKLDAGFPGRGPDVAEVGLDQDGSEGGKVMGSASADDAHREAVGLG